MRRMYVEQEDVFYYLTLMNENYAHPAMPEGAEEGILKGMYLLKGQDTKNSKLQTEDGEQAKPVVQLMGCGTILREVIEASALLENDFGVISDIWSVTSFSELRRDGIDCERWNMLHPEEQPRFSHIEQCMADRDGPVIAATDYMRAMADQVRGFLPNHYKVLGTDGFGRSDTRKNLRQFFEVDRYYVAVAALKALADEGTIDASEVSRAIALYNINPEKPNPVTV
jgi:pyruvate dehydrogenase E1 component